MHELPDIVEDIHLAEASAWLARLQGPMRSAAVEEAFRAWLAGDPAHARAYARVADIWDVIPGAARLDREKVATVPRRRRPRQGVWPAAAAACVVVVLVVAGFVWLWPRAPVYRTAAGEVKVVTLRDGTRITLNTNTRLIVDYSEHERRIRLERGEAMFEDVEDPRRPFIVAADGHQVRALGTAFQVHINPESLAVTLIEGKVAVSRGTPAKGRAKPAAATVLQPGERLILRAGGRATLDRPSIKSLTAWQRGEVVFDNVTLAYAINELNRYGGMPVRLGDPTLANMRVSGVFTVHDPAEFAKAIAKLRHLHVVRSEQSIVIVR